MRLLAILLALLMAAPASAHPAPFSYLDLRYDQDGLGGTLAVHEIDLAHELRIADPALLKDEEYLEHALPEIGPVLAARIRLAGDGPLDIQWTGIEPMPGRDAVRLTFRVAGKPGGKLTYDSDLFPYDPQHQTFVNIYDGEALQQQWIVSAGSAPRVFYRGNAEGAAQVLRTFVPSGAEHIWIGPDHLLFLLGLLLFGGGWRRLVGIVTAFTVGHSITLSLAALELVSPPAWLVEPAIALTIVVVGADNLMRGEGRDIRIWLAGVFGLVHGFGFAAVLREFGLPPEALGWSLFGFNLGVELGQLAVVLPLAVVLGALWRQRPRAARQIATYGSIVVIAGGVYWFVERAFFPGGIL
jgi:hydrogenase/urease accessory protein HupE